MPKGGARKGAGRPRVRDLELLQPTGSIIAEAISGGMTPLEYMLNVMRNTEATEARRDRMAMAAAPYCHAKPSEQPLGKKEQARVDAVAGAKGTEWGTLVQH